MIIKRQLLPGAKTLALIEGAGLAFLLLYLRSPPKIKGSFVLIKGSFFIPVTIGGIVLTVCSSGIPF
ncbi:hypothetical protein SAMN05192573_107137 [Mucilaginibacter gossypii]|uniref:Uncharacterized protein n=1 Tax=Mucilaginibacter gossypii TaxID=551996 RepID=A0A1G8ABU3_9SPHI|nr:hypothetical protein SAMN05192573_107137 [Mucilaginibacter gossypii]